MNDASISSLVSLLTIINNESEKYIYNISNPFLVSKIFVEIVLRSIYDRDIDRSLKEYPITFASHQSEGLMKDGQIEITVNKNDTEGIVLIESTSNDVHQLTRSALDVCIDVINGEFRYHVILDEESGKVIIKF